VRLASIVGTLLIVALVVSVVITVSRHDRALASEKRVSERRVDALVAQQAATAFWNEREAMNEWFLLRAPDLVTEVSAQTATFNRIVDRLDSERAHPGRPGARR
jgi:Tfp pilus assembly protein PilX